MIVTAAEVARPSALDVVLLAELAAAPHPLSVDQLARRLSHLGTPGRIGAAVHRLAGRGAVVPGDAWDGPPWHWVQGWTAAIQREEVAHAQ